MRGPGTAYYIWVMYTALDSHLFGYREMASAHTTQMGLPILSEHPFGKHDEKSFWRISSEFCLAFNTMVVESALWV